MDLLTQLQQRIPDRWFFRRLLPSVVFVLVAVVCGGQLGQAHWADLGLARERIAAALRVSGSAGSGTLASLILIAVAVPLCALAVPLASGGVSALASGAWPWWLVPPGEFLLRSRRRRWTTANSIDNASLAAAKAHRWTGTMRAARLIDRRAAAAAIPRPSSYTWTGDRFNAARDRITRDAGTDINTAWAALRLSIGDSDRAALTTARDSYDAACEAVVWAAAAVVLGAWWWPALPAGMLLGAAAWHLLRRAVTEFCSVVEAIAILHAAKLPVALRSARPVQGRGPEPGPP